MFLNSLVPYYSALLSSFEIASKPPERHFFDERAGRSDFGLSSLLNKIDSLAFNVSIDLIRLVVPAMLKI